MSSPAWLAKTTDVNFGDITVEPGAVFSPESFEQTLTSHARAGWAVSQVPGKLVAPGESVQPLIVLEGVARPRA